jgi:hypothetical protein
MLSAMPIKRISSNQPTQETQFPHRLIQANLGFHPFFTDWVGALDEMYIECIVPVDDQAGFRN